MNAGDAVRCHLERTPRSGFAGISICVLKPGLSGEREYTGPEIRMAAPDVDERRNSAGGRTFPVYPHAPGHILLQVRFMNKGNTALLDMHDQLFSGTCLQLRCNILFAPRDTAAGANLQIPSCCSNS